MKIAGYILAGGDNRRMEGKKKLLLTREGRTFGQWICGAFAGLEGVYLSVAGPETPGGAEAADEAVSGMAALGLKQISDQYGHIGPKGGIASGLSQCDADALFVAACDMPFIDQAAVERMLERFRENPGVIVAATGKKVHPLFGIYPKKVLPVLEEQIKKGDYRMMDVLNEVPHEIVNFGEAAKALRNINTIEQYAGLNQKKKPIIFAVSGYKNTGKTTLLTKVIPVLTARGYKVAVIKHDGHDFESDVPGTDSYRHQKAGAYGTAVFSANRLMIAKEVKGIDETQLFAAFPEADILLIEGLKNSPYPKYVCNYPAQEPISPEELADRILGCEGEGED